MEYTQMKYTEASAIQNKTEKLKYGPLFIVQHSCS
jgi:hypothetical protein